MFKSGWLRLWVLLTGIVVLAVALATAYYVLGTEACYRLVSVAVAENSKQEDKQLVESVKDEAKRRSFCGRPQYSAFLTLEALAKRGVVTQVGIQWDEPNGWSLNDRDMLDVLNGTQIEATEIINRVHAYVHRARFISILWWVVAALSVPVVALAVGSGIAWVRRGFLK